MKSTLIKLAILLLAFALGMFVNKVMSLQATTTSRVVQLATGEKVVDLDLNKDLYDCKTLINNEGEQIQFCVRKVEMQKTTGVAYVRGVTLPKENKIYIDKNLSSCSIAHELGHLEGLNEEQAYDISSLCYQLQTKGIWQAN